MSYLLAIFNDEVELLQHCSPFPPFLNLEDGILMHVLDIIRPQVIVRWNFFPLQFHKWLHLLLHFLPLFKDLGISVHILFQSQLTCCHCFVLVVSDYLPCKLVLLLLCELLSVISIFFLLLLCCRIQAVLQLFGRQCFLLAHWLLSFCLVSLNQGVLFFLLEISLCKRRSSQSWRYRGALALLMVATSALFDFQANRLLLKLLDLLQLLLYRRNIFQIEINNIWVILVKLHLNILFDEF